MSGVLAVAEAWDGALRASALEAVACGRQLADAGAGPLTVALVAPGADALVASLPAAGADRVVVVEAPAGRFEPHVAERVLEALIADAAPAVVLLSQSADALAHAPAVAARGGLGFAADVHAVDWDGGLVVRRGAYGDRLEAELDFPGRERVLVTVRAGTHEPAAGPPATAVQRLDVPLAADAARTELLGVHAPAGEGGGIAGATVLVALGAGISDRETLAACRRLARGLGAELCASRPLVDAGWLPRSCAVGVSAASVAPKVYLALGVSGAAQHLDGIRGAETVIAVNIDPAAPIFGVARYGAHVDVRAFARAAAARVG